MYYGRDEYTREHNLHKHNIPSARKCKLKFGNYHFAVIVPGFQRKYGEILKYAVPTILIVLLAEILPQVFELLG